MKLAFGFAIVALLIAPAQDENWLEELRKMDDQVNAVHGPLYVLRSLRQEMQRALKALDESRLDAVDRHLLRLAHVSRPYNENHANQIVALAIALRGETRSDGAALVAAVAEDLKQGRTKEAQARVDEALKAPFLATTHRAEIERLNAWVKKAPDSKALEAELARWTALMPPGYALACAACGSKGEADCTLCSTGLVMQSCRTCSGKGLGACALCAGKSKLSHGGFAGDIILRIDKLFRYKVAGEKGIRRVDPQRIFWNLTPCGGKGRVRLKAYSVYFDPKLKADPPVDLMIPCTEIFAQMKANVFNGKAKIFAHPKEDKNEMTVEQAQRFFEEYEKCEAGKLACDSCDGKGQGMCRPCTGKGLRLGPCSGCAGAGAAGCSTCKVSGDSSWLAAKVEPKRLGVMGKCLDAHVRALQVWQDKRSVARARREQVRGQLVDARKGIEPDAKLTTDFVNVKCDKCAGRGGACEACWGVGRREYFAGTPVHDKYLKVKKLEEQFALLSRASLGVSSDEIQLVIKDEYIDSGFQLPKAAEVPPPPPPKPGVGSGIGGKIADLPQELRDAIAKADQLHQDGKKSYDLAVAAGDDNEKRKAEAVRAKDCFKQAAELYGKTLETLDEQGINTPAELNEKYNLNLQALKLARNMAF
ncbi:MAG TPA: hypothetical protein VFS19_04585 [Planctomycetota bacterium]|nr:hypothetical protein [Planctomycetota bacterium]